MGGGRAARRPAGPSSRGLRTRACNVQYGLGVRVRQAMGHLWVGFLALAPSACKILREPEPCAPYAAPVIIIGEQHNQPAGPKALAAVMQRALECRVPVDCVFLETWEVPPECADAGTGCSSATSDVPVVARILTDDVLAVSRASSARVLPLDAGLPDVLANGPVDVTQIDEDFFVRVDEPRTREMASAILAAECTHGVALVGARHVFGDPTGPLPRTNVTIPNLLATARQDSTVLTANCGPRRELVFRFDASRWQYAGISTSRCR